jgi:hypothetical protein
MMKKEWQTTTRSDEADSYKYELVYMLGTAVMPAAMALWHIIMTCSRSS